AFASPGCPPKRPTIRRRPLLRNVTPNPRKTTFLSAKKSHAMACEDAWHDQWQAMKSKAKAIRKRSVFPPIGVGIVAALCCLAQPSFSSTQAQPQSQPPKTRRSQRVHMQEVQVASPDG